MMHERKSLTERKQSLVFEYHQKKLADLEIASDTSKNDD